VSTRLNDTLRNGDATRQTQPDRGGRNETGGHCLTVCLPPLFQPFHPCSVRDSQPFWAIIQALMESSYEVRTPKTR